MKKLLGLCVVSAITFCSGVAFAETATNAAQDKVATTKEKMMPSSAKKPAEMTAKKPKRGMIGQYKGVGSRSVARFNKVDADKNGKISQSEFTNSHSVAFNRKDKNKDGQLTPAEFSPTLAKKSAGKM
jgi:hypothetical protein